MVGQSAYLKKLLWRKRLVGNAHFVNEAIPCAVAGTIVGPYAELARVARIVGKRSTPGKITPQHVIDVQTDHRSVVCHGDMMPLAVGNFRNVAADHGRIQVARSAAAARVARSG